MKFDNQQIQNKGLGMSWGSPALPSRHSLPARVWTGWQPAGLARQTAQHKNQASLDLTGVTWDRPSAVSLVPTLSGRWGVIPPPAV